VSEQPPGDPTDSTPEPQGDPTAAQTAKESLHHLIDALPEDQASDIHDILRLVLPHVDRQQDFAIAALPPTQPPEQMTDPSPGEEQPIDLGVYRIRARDASGGEGEYSARFRLSTPVPPSEAKQLGIIPGIYLLLIDEDYSAWPMHQAIRASVIGIGVNHTIDDAQLKVYEGLNRNLYVVLLRQEVRVTGSSIFGRIDWNTDSGLGACSLHGFDPEGGKLGDLRDTWDAMKFIAHIARTKPGPKPGTVAKKYPTKDAWHAALREKVLTKRLASTADDTTIATWLGTSTTWLYHLMRRWGPKTLADLRDGRF
jgi:hypothetical protein